MNLELWELVKENIAVIAAGLTLITAVLSATIAFINNIRHKDRDRFYQNAEENLYKLIEPMYFKVNNIKNIKDCHRKIESIKKFFNTYNPEKINVSKLGNRKLINRFIETHSAYSNYLIEFDDRSMKFLFLKVKSLEYFLDKEYWKLFEAIYKDYNYFKRTVDMNYLFRFFYRISIFIENTFFAISWIVVAVIIFAMLDEFSKESIWIEDFKLKVLYLLLFFCISQLILYISSMINFAVADDIKQKKTFYDYLTLGLTYLWKKGSLKCRELKREKAIREEERESMELLEENDETESG
ncbi:hypothetical protein ACFCVS_05365 [Bacillus altitudinis]|uniref:hypothetical protein n=2 Tax=Bacillus altitudinis TaxID=293387 RepID=UPI00107164BD|nr:hypothetical protein [Bacillus altitudinis]MBU8694128.1 hypothetical protein [Bacillus altitudinis]QEO62384.1 hypothetical protein EVS87_009245 [Bacillus altitudinis]WHY07203.1 hypothetical protein QNH34_09325 [Bacillus altitudinis]